MIINTDTGKLIYDRDYSNRGFGLIKDPNDSKSAAFADPLNLSGVIYSMIRLHETSFVEEYNANRVLNISGSVNFLFEYLNEFPVVLIILYQDIKYEIIRSIAPSLLNVFMSKYQEKALMIDSIRYSFSQAESLFLPIYENLIVHTVKYMAMELNEINIIVPWIYLCLISKPKEIPKSGTLFFPAESATSRTLNGNP